MDNLSNKFDKFFGVKAQWLPKSTKKENEGEAKMTHFISHKADNRSMKKNGVHLTWEQKDFCTHINQKEGAPFELIVFLRVDNAGVLVEEVRGMDFHLKREYKVYPKSRTFERIQGILPIHGNWRAMRGFRGSGYYVFTWRFAAPTATNLCPIEIDRHGYFAPFTEEQLVLAIRQSKIGSSSFSSDETSGLYDTLAKQLQKAGDEIFIYELLQNASDKPFGETVDVQIQLVPQRNDGGKVRGGFLKFSHTGSVFDFLDVAAICSANQKSKIDVNKIGYKGIGFKTVFRYNSRVEIRSGKFGFAFDEERTRDVRPELPWMTLPDTVQPNSKGDFRVDIRMFPRDKDLRFGSGEKSYQQLLLRLFKDERPLLFIPRLRWVKIIIPNMPDIIRSPLATDWCRSRVFCESVGDDIRIAIKHELDANDNSRIPEKYRNLQSTSVMFACGVDGRRLKTENVETSHLYCYLPAADAHWGLPFLMNTDMVPDGNRANIEYGVVEVNKFFAHVAGEKFCEWISDLIEGGKYAYDSIFDLIPNFEECVKGRLEAAPFIREFQSGFEDRLSKIGFKLPDESGKLVSAHELSDDKTGVLENFGCSLWQRFQGVGRAVHKSLQGSQSYKNFVVKYKDKLGIKIFCWNDLCAECQHEEIRSWLKNPNANSLFVKFLLGSDKLSQFSDVAIYLDNRGELGRSDEMYRYGDGVKNVERWLPKFAHLARYLSPKVTYHEKLCDVKFKGFEPRTFLKECVLSVAAIRDTCTALREIETAKGFWSFVAHYRMNDGKERFADDYELLGILPFVTESGEVVDSLVNKDFSVYVRDEQSDAKILQYKWFGSRVKFVAQEYFTCDEGPAIKNLLTDSLFADKKRLVGKIEFRDVLVNVFAKFKDEILVDMKAAASDMGAYSFLSDCVANNCVNMKWLQEQITTWPVEDVGGKLVERVGKHVWYSCDQLPRILSSKWMDGNGLVVLSEKYDAQRALFDILGAKDFEKVGFGEFFREEIFGHLNKNCDVVDLVDFHEYMCGQVADGRLTSDKQLAAWKKSPVIVDTKDGTIQTEGCSDILISKEHLDVQLEIAEGHLPATARVLSTCMLTDKATEEYWEKLGFQLLDGSKFLQKTIEAYLGWQNGIKDGEELGEEFKSRHLKFVMSMASRCVDVALLQGIKLLDAKGTLVSPADLVLPQEYSPECEFQRYGCDLRYVSACYHDGVTIEGMASFLRDLGVRDEFFLKDVPFLRERGFCRYFWTEYSKSHEINEEIITSMNAAPCVLDRAGVVRKPCELYSIVLEHPYVSNIDAADEKLPLCENVNVTLYEKLDFRKSLTASDAVTFLLADADGSRYAFRGRALKWIDEGELSSSDIERYRNDEYALWRNAKNGQLTHVRNLCVIKSRDANRVRSHFSNSEFVCDLRGVDNGDSRISREVLERAFERLGVVLVDNSSLKPIPNGEEVDKDIKNEIKTRLLILLALSAEMSWRNDYKDKEQIIDACEFYVCESFTEFCTQFDRLKSERGTFAEQDGKVYYAGGWQDKRVYLDVIRFLKKKLELGQYTDDDLKDAFDTDGGLCGLARRLIDDYTGLLTDEEFIVTMRNVNAGLIAQIQEELSKSTTPGPQPAPINPPRTIVPPFPPVPPRKYYSADEEMQMRRVFRNDLSVEEMNDINRLDCVRLFNSLMAQGFQPKMMYSQNDSQAQKTYDDFSPEELEKDFIVDAYDKRRLRHSATIETNDGRQIHVIGAINGVAHLPPKWWVRIANQEEFGCAKYVVCAIVSHRDDGFQYIRTKSELKIAIGGNFTVVRVQSEDVDERLSKTMDLFSRIPERSDYSTYALLLLHSMKADKSYENVFHVLESANDGSDNDYRE